MQVVDLPLDQLREAAWNANTMPPELLTKLKASMRRYGVVVPLVVRRQPDGVFEVLSGNQRVKAVRELDYQTIPCVIVSATDAEARLLAQALNRLHGEDDLGLRAEVLRDILMAIPERDVLSVLPDTIQSLQALASLGQEGIATHLAAWQAAQGARLHHRQFQFTVEDLPVVEEALTAAVKEVKDKGDSPNLRGQAFVAICQRYLKAKRLYAAYRRRAS